MNTSKNKSKTNLQTQKVKIDLIKPYWRNARINTKTIDILKKSISEYGYNQPIVIDKKNVIIVGHARYKALLELGYTEIDVIILTISEKKAKQYRIIDNKSAEISQWDNEMLNTELREIYENIPIFNELYPDFNKLAQTINYVQVSEESINKQEQKNQHQFKQKNEKEMKEYIELICPECGKTFNVKRSDILTRDN